jgi:hypothetical protein
MKKTLRTIFILLLTFLTMIIVNESMRGKVPEKPYQAHDIKTINSAKYIPTRCSWACHNDTAYCKKKHVKYLKPYLKISDLFYFGLIGLLASTGNYGLANIVILVILLPGSILYFTLKAWNIQDEITQFIE